MHIFKLQTNDPIMTPPCAADCTMMHMRLLIPRRQDTASRRHFSEETDSDAELNAFAYTTHSIQCDVTVLHKIHC